MIVIYKKFDSVLVYVGISCKLILCLVCQMCVYPKPKYIFVLAKLSTYLMVVQFKNIVVRVPLVSINDLSNRM